MALAVAGQAQSGGAAPVLASADRTTAWTGSGPMPITLIGSGFVSASSAQWNGSALTTTMVSGTQLAAVIPAENLKTAGRFSITVSNGSAGGVSGPLNFTVLQTPDEGPYRVGVDYHAYGADFLHTAFIAIYDQAAVRQQVQAQLQGMADRGATVIKTAVFMVQAAGETSPETWRCHFPLSDQEQANLHAYAQDVAAVQGKAGNRLRLDIALSWLGIADYTTGSPDTGLGFFQNVTAAQYTSWLATTTDKVVAAVSGIARPDGVPVVETVYMDGEVMYGAKANTGWFLTSNYPRFVNVVSGAGFRPSLYFNASDYVANILQTPYTDADYPILNNHRGMFWTYRTLRFMADNGLPIPSRIDFSYYISDFSPTAPFGQLLSRTLDDADATLPSLGAPHSYGLAETMYPLDDVVRRQYGQTIAAEAVRNARLKRAEFWTTPDGGGGGVNIGYPFAVEDYLLIRRRLVQVTSE